MSLISITELSTKSGLFEMIRQVTAHVYCQRCVSFSERKLTRGVVATGSDDGRAHECLPGARLLSHEHDRPQAVSSTCLSTASALPALVRYVGCITCGWMIPLIVSRFEEAEAFKIQYQTCDRQYPVLTQRMLIPALLRQDHGRDHAALGRYYRAPAGDVRYLLRAEISISSTDVADGELRNQIPAAALLYRFVRSRWIAVFDFVCALGVRDVAVLTWTSAGGTVSKRRRHQPPKVAAASSSSASLAFATLKATLTRSRADQVARTEVDVTLAEHRVQGRAAARQSHAFRLPLGQDQ
eukprot:3797748-Rhodomonas_salina.1